MIDRRFATFSIEDQEYLILPEPADDSACKARHSPAAGCPDDNVAGRLAIGDKRYVVIQAGACISHNGCTASSEKTERSMDALTKRELQIVLLVAEGKVNKQIADRLHISEWTVSTHMRRIFAKLGVYSRSAMVYRCASLLK